LVEGSEKRIISEIDQGMGDIAPLVRGQLIFRFLGLKLPRVVKNTNRGKRV